MTEFSLETTKRILPRPFGYRKVYLSDIPAGTTITSNVQCDENGWYTIVAPPREPPPTTHWCGKMLQDEILRVDKEGEYTWLYCRKAGETEVCREVEFTDMPICPFCGRDLG